MDHIMLEKLNIGPTYKKLETKKHDWLIVESFLVCHPKNGGVLG